MNDLTFDDEGTQQVPKPAPTPASEKSLKFMRDLIRDKQWVDMVQAMPQEWQDLFNNIKSALVNMTLEEVAERRAFAQSDVSKFITELLKQPKVEKHYSQASSFAHDTQPKRMAPETDGIYMKDNKFYKVYWNLGQERLLTKVLDIVGTNSDGRVVSEWRYLGMAHRYVSKDDIYQPTLEEAVEFGPMYGRCGICGRTLNQELSMALGIGPVCGDREFGGEFKIMLRAVKERLGL